KFFLKERNSRAQFADWPSVDTEESGGKESDGDCIAPLAAVSLCQRGCQPAPRLPCHATGCALQSNQSARRQ
ncbi:unnamed protein product, partial [Closterium sp. Naga37s-1]